MKVFVTGGTGFTGSHVVPTLVAAGHSVRCLVRDPARAAHLSRDGVELVTGDLGDGVNLRQPMAGCDTLLHVASMGFGHVPGVIAAAEGAGIRRAVFTSTTAIFTRLNASSKTLRLAAEAAVQQSRLDWVIIRPTMIFGSSRDRNFCRLARLVARSPLIPVVGPGTFLMQPVYVGDLAAALVAAVVSPAASRRAYNVSGLEPLTYNQLIHITAELMGRKVRIVRFPAAITAGALKLFENCGIRVPVKAEQIDRLNEDKSFSWAEAGADLGYRPRSFRAAMQLELADLGYRRTCHLEGGSPDSESNI